MQKQDIYAPLLDSIKASPAFRELHIQAGTGTPVPVYNLAGSFRAMALAALVRESDKPVLVIAESSDRAEELREDLVELLDEDRVDHFPGGEMSHYHEKGMSIEERSDRITTLRNITEKRHRIVVCTIRSLLEKIIPPAAFANGSLRLTKDQDIPFEETVEKLAAAGYERLPMVEQYGQFSVRGGIIDVFPVDRAYPVRIEFWGDTVESIRLFNLSSQRSIEEGESIFIPPYREILLSPAATDALFELFGENETETLNQRLLEHRGLELYLPYVYDKPASLLDYLGHDTLIVTDDFKRLGWEGEFVNKQAFTDYETHHAKHKDAVLPKPEELYFDHHEVMERLQTYGPVNTCMTPPEDGSGIDFTTVAQAPFSGRVEFLKEKLEEWADEDYHITIFADSPANMGRLSDLLETDDGLPVTITVGSINHGFVFHGGRQAVYTDREVFHRVHQRYRPRRFTGGIPIESYRNLHFGDYVVHEDYGVGIYQGVHHIKMGVVGKECLVIEYKNHDKIFVPVEQLDRLNKYIGSEGTAPAVNSLKGSSWEKTKSKIRKGIEIMAKDLLDLYAQRQLKPGISYGEDTDWQKELEASFIYEETPDQLKALEAVKQDLEAPRPMDRLVCGDVGFGKTEVAVRAAFKVVSNGKQVAVLVPTTILAQQHYNTFKERLAGFPVVVEMLSRFKTKAEQTDIVKRLKAGKVEIIIGTHRLLSKDIEFPDLGLMVVDEEQRFGVKHKEKIKAMKEEVDVLTLTATPIPRTLYMSLMGIRNLSLVNTPPKGRMPIRTDVMQFNKDAIAEAIMREVRRGGQVYFVHNRVQTMPGMYNFLKKLLPDLRICVGHGQMPEAQLEKVMLDFMERKYDVLLCSMIIESGLDIPNVNTIIVNRADTFGLAQLYQLRGRVGRSTEKAYAYLLIPPWSTLDTIAKKRITTIQEFSDLGAGYKIASRDMEIRGAGNLLGRQQHGFVTAVGFDLYCQLLEEAVANLKGEQVEKKIDPVIKIPVSAYLPTKYIADTHQKVNLYYRLAEMKTPEEVDSFKTELIDRFGKMPVAAEALLASIKIKQLAKKLKMTEVNLQKDTVTLTFDPSFAANKTVIEMMVQGASMSIEFDAGKNFAIKAQIGDQKTTDKLERIVGLMGSLLH